MAKKVGILGSGKVGQVLAAGFRGLGFEVAVGNRSGHPVDGWSGQVGTYADVAHQAELLVLCVPGAAAEDLVISLEGQLAGKTVIDTTNPIAAKPPEDGVLHYFTTLDESLMERLQKAAPDAHFVKAFNSVGNNEMVQPKFKEGRPTMFICGDDADAKHEVTDILDKLGWETADMGTAKAARAIEPLCMLWCIPAIAKGRRNHAFKLLKQ